MLKSVAALTLCASLLSGCINMPPGHLYPVQGALAAQTPIALAVRLANFAAGAVVAKLGTATASPDEILALVAGSRV